MSDNPVATPRPSDAARLRRAIAAQREIAATAGAVEDLIAEVVDRARYITGATGAVIELMENGRVNCRAVVGQVEQTGATEVAVPVLEQGQTVGRLRVQGEGPETFDDVDVECLEVLSDLVGIRLTHSSHYELLVEQGLHDPLTRLANLRAFEIRLAQEVARFARYGTPLTLALLDVDALAGINEAWGYSEGDRVLTDVARLLVEEVRASDTVFRMGGDEFAVILANTAEDAGTHVARRVAAEAGRAGSMAGPVTLSVGVAAPRESDPNALRARAAARLRTDKG